MKIEKLRKKIAVLLAGSWFCFASLAFAAQPLTLELNESHYIDAGGHISRIAVGNPTVADVTTISSNELLVVAKGAGATTLIVWTDGGERQEYTLQVGGKDSNMEYTLHNEMKLPNVHVQHIDKNVMLSGMVNNQYEHDMAMRYAALYVGKDNVVDMMEMTNPSQVELRAQILEISASDAKKIGLQYASPTAKTKDTNTGFTTVTLGDAGTFTAGEDFGGNHDTKYWLLNHFSTINATINALVTNGKAKLISQPSITTMSGEKASILIGGRIPIPVSGNNGQVTVEWRDYGVRLNIEPKVDKDDNITSKVHAEVSTLDYSNAVKNSSFTIPAIASREAEAVINVPSGMTMAIGGLMNTEDSKTITRVPLLSNIPILGELFKHNSTTTNKRELIILITPRIVNETTPAEMSDKMKENYQEGKTEKSKMNKVDLNGTDTPAENPAPVEAAADKDKSETVQPDPSAPKGPSDKEQANPAKADNDSLLGKYLNREVLPIEPTKEK